MKKLLDLGILILCWGVIKKMMTLWKRVLVPFLNQMPPRKLVSYCCGGVSGPSILLRKTFKLKETDSSLVRRENYIMNITPYQFSVQDFIVLPGFSPCEQGEKEKEKRRFCLNHGKLSKSPQRELSGHSILYCLIKQFFSSASIRLLINRWSKLSPLYQAHRFKAWVRNWTNMQRMLSKDHTRYRYSDAVLLKVFSLFREIFWTPLLARRDGNLIDWIL